MPSRKKSGKLVRVFHPRAEEAEPLLRMIRDAGHGVFYDPAPGTKTVREIKEEGATAIVIDLSRLPSHGRDIGSWVRGSKSIRHLPLIFAGGDPAKVAAIRTRIPDATYASYDDLLAALRQAKPLANPVVPRQAMQTPAGRTNAQKLGIAANARVALIDAPRDCERVMGAMPEGAAVVEEAPASVTLWFVHDPAEFEAALPRRRALAGKSKLWIVWPKGRKDGFNGDFVRARALKLGLVDYKICSLSETWSGMLFSVKKAPV